MSRRGNRLLPTLVDEIAANDPTRIIFSYPSTAKLEDGFRNVQFGEFANAINRCSWWLEEKLGRSETFGTLAYLGPVNPTYLIIVFAAIKVGYKLFLSSPSNSIETHVKLLADLQCDVMLTSANKPPAVDSIVSAKNMKLLTVSSLDELLADGRVSTYPYTKAFDQARDEPFVVLHTSGSTGFPKPVILNHGSMTQHDLHLETPKLSGKQTAMSRFSGKRVFFGLPVFHSGVICFLAFSIYSRTTPVFSASFLPTAEDANKAHVYGQVQGSLLVPSVLVEITRNPEYLENVKHLEYVTFGGAPLLKEIGDILKDHTHLFVSFGTTEAGMYALEALDREDWEYASFSPLMGCELRPFFDNLFEFVFVRREELRDFQGIFSTFPKMAEYRPQDLYSKHPTKEGLWLYEGRSDDTVVIYNGYKLNPRSMEGTLNAHPLIRSALVCGTGRPRYSLLIEAKAPPKTEEERSVHLAEIWPTVEQINLTASPYAQIDRDKVIFTSPQKPMLRAGKGSIQRKVTEQLYSGELGRLYKA
ncbi:MAG: hypothetical protein M1821_001576 [Bathelium mastoideum]|nr:MAG: hypothetical protein M1821_001576 [Bathelium mastoideum]